MLKPLTADQLGHEDALIVFKYNEFNNLMNNMIDLLEGNKELLKLFWDIQDAKKAMIEC